MAGRVRWVRAALAAGAFAVVTAVAGVPVAASAADGVCGPAPSPSASPSPSPTTDPAPTCVVVADHQAQVLEVGVEGVWVLAGAVLAVVFALAFGPLINRT